MAALLKDHGLKITLLRLFGRKLGGCFDVLCSFLLHARKYLGDFVLLLSLGSRSCLLWLYLNKLSGKFVLNDLEELNLANSASLDGRGGLFNF